MRRLSPLEYLQVDIASRFGLDKKSWEERLDWVKTNESKLESLENQADEPAEYYASVCAYRAAQRGEAIGHAIALDATSSGISWLSVLTDDRLGALLTNVLNSGERSDLYTKAYQKIAKILGNNPFITRDKIKKAIVASSYGSRAKPKELFGENTDVFDTVMNNMLPRAWQLNQFFSDNWISDKDTIRWILPDNFHVNCTVKCMVEEEFVFNGKVRKFIHEEIKACKDGRGLAANSVHSLDSFAVREITALAMHNPSQIQRIKNYMNQKGMSFSLEEVNKKNYEMVKTLVKLYEESGFLSARVLDYIDKYSISLVPEDELRELLSLVPEKPFKLYVVHDDFRVHPNYGNDIRWLYITQLARVSRSNMLQFILRQMYEDKNIKVNRADPDMWKDILNSEYALS